MNGEAMAKKGTPNNVASQVNPDYMPEAEVSLRLASFLLDKAGRQSTVRIALDGAHVACRGQQIFPLAKFLAEQGWRQTEQGGKNSWQGRYSRESQAMIIHCTSGEGDVVCTVGQTTYRAECKKGPLQKKKGNPEYPLLREALGQLLTIETLADTDVLVAAVPYSVSFARLAEEWRQRPLIKRTGVRIALVFRDGKVSGL